MNSQAIIQIKADSTSHFFLRTVKKPKAKPEKTKRFPKQWRPVVQRVTNWLLTLALLILLSDVTFARVTYDGNGTVTSNSPDVSSVFMPGFSVPEGSDRLLLVTVDYLLPASSILSVTFDGVDLTHAVTDTEGAASLEIWYLVLGDGVEVTGDIIATLDGVTNSTRAGAASFKKVDQANPIGSTQTTGLVYSTSSSLTVPSTPNHGVFDAIYAAGFAGGLTSGDLQTEVFSILSANYLSGSFRAASSNSTQMEWTSGAASPFVHAAIEINWCCLSTTVRIGTESDDELNGDEEDNQIYAFFGADVLHGGDGDDSLYGDAGNDFLYPGPGDNCIDGGEGHDTIDFSGFGYGAAGGGGGGGSSGGGFLLGAAFAAAVDIDEDYRLPEDFQSTHIVDPDDPRLSPSPGTEENVCGDGFPTDPDSHIDTIVNVEEIIGSQFDDTITGDADQNIFDGSGGDDIINGAGGDDFLFGGNGDDVIDGGEGNDIIDGGEGMDIAQYDDIEENFIVTPEGPNWLVVDSTSDDVDELTGIEMIRFEDSVRSLAPTPVPSFDFWSKVFLIFILFGLAYKVLRKKESYQTIRSVRSGS